MIDIVKDLWLERRDLVSDGFDRSLDYISKIIPLKIHKFKTGLKCWTWTVPPKWSIGEAFIEDLDGNKLLDLENNPLHVVSYSLPINKIVSREELFKHLHSNPKRPDAIPFEFKYYERDWGFCIQRSKLKDFTAEKYRVVIDSGFEQGTLKVGDFTIKGESEETIVLVAHLCHPGMANDDLAGVAVAVDLAKELSEKKNYYSYKFLFLPETIGSIAFLSQNEDLIPKLKAGIFLEMLGNDNDLALQYSRQGNEKIDRVAKYVMNKKLNYFREGGFRKIIGNDEMVFNGPGVNVPMISISRFPYAEYHTSDDNLGIIFPKRLEEAKVIVVEILRIIEADFVPKRKFKGPVFLSGCGLWVDWRSDMKLNKNLEQIMLRLEGNKSVFDIAEELGMDFDTVKDYLERFYEKGLIEKFKGGVNVQG